LYMLRNLCKWMSGRSNQRRWY